MSRTWKRPAHRAALPGSLLNYAPHGGASTLLFRIPGRSNAKHVDRVSRDTDAPEPFRDGMEGPRVYPTWCSPDGSVGILYENGDPGGREALYRRISFETVSPGRLFD